MKLLLVLVGYAIYSGAILLVTSERGIAWSWGFWARVPLVNRVLTYERWRSGQYKMRVLGLFFVAIVFVGIALKVAK